MFSDRSVIKTGMSVRDASGAKLGKIGTIGADSFEIEKGIFFKDHYRAGYDEIESFDSSGNGEIILSMTRASASGPISSTGTVAASVATSTDETRIPLYEETLEVTKRQRDAGEVKVKKHVTTEHRTMSVPVMHERVQIEHVAAPSSSGYSAGDFSEEEFSIPLKEEEVEVSKRAFVREEVRVIKTADTEMREVGEDLRHEELEIEDSSTYRGDPMPDRT